MKRAVIALLCASAPASADPKLEAQHHIDLAAAFHENNRLPEALEELKTAYALDPQPRLLYAIAQVHVQLGRCPEAIDYYERYLTTKPAQQQATIARRAIETCKSKPPDPVAKPPKPVDVPKPVEPPPVPAVVVQPPSPPPGPNPWYRDPVGDALLGGGVVLGVVGVVLYRGALGKLDDAATATSHDQAAELVSSAHDGRTYSIVFGVAGAGLIAAGVYRVLHHGESHAITVAPVSGGAAVTWSARF